MTKTETYKGFNIEKRGMGWAAYDADGFLFSMEKTKSCLRGFISAYVDGQEWAINEAKHYGYEG